MGWLWSETAGCEMELPFCVPGPHLLRKNVSLSETQRGTLSTLPPLQCDEHKTLMRIGEGPNLIHSLNLQFFFFFARKKKSMHLSHLEILQSLSKCLQTISSIWKHFEA